MIDPSIPIYPIVTWHCQGLPWLVLELKSLMCIDVNCTALATGEQVVFGFDFIAHTSHALCWQMRHCNFTERGQFFGGWRLGWAGEVAGFPSNPDRLGSLILHQPFFSDMRKSQRHKKT